LKQDTKGDEKMKSELRSFVFTLVVTILFFFNGVKAHSYLEVSLPDTTAEHGDTIAIPVIVSDLTGEEIYAFQVFLTFDSTVLAPDSAYSTGTIAQGWGAPTFNDSIPGRINIAQAGTTPLSGSGVLVYAVFVVKGSQGDTTTIHFDEIWLNEDPPDVITDGLFTVGPSSDVGDEDEIPGKPGEFTLYQNYPNPFNPITVIQYALPRDCEVEITLYNVSGQKIKTLVKRKEKAGYREVRWDGKNDEGEQVASGIYLYTIKAGEFTQSKKMLIIK
jgi:hypothetical protein